MVNVIFYIAPTCCPWRLLPKDFAALATTAATWVIIASVELIPWIGQNVMQPTRFRVGH